MAEEYKSNAHADKANDDQPSEEIRVKKVIEGTVEIQKRSEFQKFWDGVVYEDFPKIKKYVIWDVLVPAFKNALSNIIKTGSDMIIYGAPQQSTSNGGRSRPRYRDYYSNDYPREIDQRAERTRYSYNDLVFKTNGEAEEVLDILEDTISNYGWVRVADLYNAAGVEATYTDCYWGWDEHDFKNVGIVAVNGGWVIKFPKPSNRDRR